MYTVIYKEERFKSEHLPDIKKHLLNLQKPSNFFTWEARILTVSLKLLKILGYKRNTNSITDFNDKIAAF